MGRALGGWNPGWEIDCASAKPGNTRNCLTWPKMEKEILETVRQTLEELKGQGRPWYGLAGDVCCRAVMRFLENRACRTYAVVGPNAWIKDIPTEFDILITKLEACPFKFTAIYDPKDVFACLEIKETGLFAGKGELTRVIGRKKTQFDEVKHLYPHIECGYLTLSEVCNPVRPQSINFLSETLKGLAPHAVFCLRDSRSGKIREGEWKRFLDWVDLSASRMQE